MNIIINRFPKVSFKAAALPAQQTNTPASFPTVSYDTFEKSDKKELPASEYSSLSKTAAPKYPSGDYTTTSIFYISDLHGKMTNMERICEMARLFDANTTAEAKLKLASGDILLGSNPMTNKVASNFLNWIGVKDNALGNHELDATPAALAEATPAGESSTAIQQSADSPDNAIPFRYGSGAGLLCWIMSPVTMKSKSLTICIRSRA